MPKPKKKPITRKPDDIDSLIAAGLAREIPNPDDPDDPIIELSPELMMMLEHDGDAQ